MSQDSGMDNQTAVRLKKQLAEEFRRQLTFGAPNNEDEAGLHRLAQRLKRKKVIAKLFLRHPLHAKLYLLFRPDPINPIMGYLGSSNLTMAGLADQGELNIDILDHDATQKLARWFDNRWNDRFCIDISKELIQIIEESWAREDLIPPYHIYIKMAYHLAEEARAGLSEFRIPHELKEHLLELQEAAVRIAAHHVNKRSGVLVGDVVGLGKTLMATALARIFEDDYGIRGRSNAEVVSKLEVGLQELEETRYWFELLAESGIVKPEGLSSLDREADELTAILVTCIKKVKGRSK